jgi:hypothetical protein
MITSIFPTSSIGCLLKKSESYRLSGINGDDALVLSASGLEKVL